MFGFIKTRKTQTSLSYPDRSSTMEGRMGYSFRGQAWGQNRLVLKKTLKDRAATLVKDATHHRVHRPNGFSWPKRRQEQKESWSVSHNFVRSSHEPIALLWPTLNSGQKKKSECETQTDQLTPGILHSSLAFLVRLTECLIIDASPQQQKWESISQNYDHRKTVTYPSRGHGCRNTWAAEGLLACAAHTNQSENPLELFRQAGKSMLSYRAIKELTSQSSRSTALGGNEEVNWNTVSWPQGKFLTAYYIRQSYLMREWL